MQLLIRKGIRAFGYSPEKFQAGTAGACLFRRAYANQFCINSGHYSGNRTQRNPLLLFVLFGLLLLRLAERVFLSLLFHEPPRAALQSPFSKDYTVLIQAPISFPISNNISEIKTYCLVVESCLWWVMRK